MHIDNLCGALSMSCSLHLDGSVGGFEVGEGGVYLGLEGVEGLSPADEGQPLDLGRVVGVGSAENEARRTGKARFASFGHVPSHRRCALGLFEALLEAFDVETQCLGVAAPGLERLLILEQPCVHLGEATLLAGAVRRQRRLEGERVDARQRQIEPGVPQPAGVEVLLLDLRERLTDVSGAVWSLIVGELDQGEARRKLTFDRVVAEIELFARHVGSRRPGWSGGAGGDQLADLLQLLLDVLLPALELLDVAPKIGVALLRRGRRRRAERRQTEREQARGQRWGDASHCWFEPKLLDGRAGVKRRSHSALGESV